MTTRPRRSAGGRARAGGRGRRSTEAADVATEADAKTGTGGGRAEECQRKRPRTGKRKKAIEDDAEDTFIKPKKEDTDVSEIIGGDIEDEGEFETGRGICFPVGLSLRCGAAIPNPHISVRAVAPVFFGRALEWH